MYKPPRVPQFSEVEFKNSKPGKFVNAGAGNNNTSGGFFVRDAPWDNSSMCFKCKKKNLFN